MNNSHIIDYIDYNLVYHCNLNCSACYHFCPLVKEKNFVNINDTEKILSRFNDILGNNKKYIELRILGGEPLLYPNIIEMFYIIRKCLPYSSIALYTNGLLLDEFLNDNDFYNSLIKNNIKIYVSNYHINNKIFNKYNIIIPKDKAVFSTKYLSLENNLNKYFCKFKNFYNSCSSIDWYGNYHFCGLTETIHYLNEYYNYNFKTVKDKDYINIFSNITYYHILKLKYNIRPFCGYCREPQIINWKKFNNENLWIVQ